MKKLIFLILFTFTVFTSENIFSNILEYSQIYSQTTDSIRKNVIDTINKGQNILPIDTMLRDKPQQIVVPIDTITRMDSALIGPESQDTMTNTQLFIYILLSALGLGLFFFIFVITLFKTFHKKKSTRQSLLLSWNLFFIISIIWIFIIWGLVAGFWTYASFMIVVIFLFIISLIMTIIAVKSK